MPTEGCALTVGAVIKMEDDNEHDEVTYRAESRTSVTGSEGDVGATGRAWVVELQGRLLILHLNCDGRIGFNEGINFAIYIEGGAKADDAGEREQ